MKSHSKRILSLVFALLMAFQQVMFAAQTVDLLTPAEQTQTVDLLTGEEENKTVDLLTPAEPSAPIEQPVEQPIEQSKPIIEENKETENQTVDLLTPGDDEVVPEEGKKSTTTILIGGEEEEETQDDSWDLTPAEITVPEENHDEEEKKDATFEDEEHHENAGVLPWSTDLVKPWSIYREPKKVYRPGEDLDLTELLVEIKTGRSGSLYNIEDLINDEFTTITRTRKSDGEKVRLDDKIYEDETMTIHMDGCQDLTIDFTVDENLKDEEEALEAFQENLIREEFRDGLDFSLYLIKKGERENPIVAYSLDPHKLTPLGNGVDKKLKDGPLFDLKDINSWDRFDIETIGKVKAILERSAEIKNNENVRKKLITQLAIWNVTSNIIPREIDATVSENEENETNEFGPELKPTDEEEVPEEKEEEPIEIIDPTTPEEEIESDKQDDEVEAVEEKTQIEKTEAEEKTETEEPAEDKTEAEEPVEEKAQENKEAEKIEEQAPVQSTVHKIVFDVREIDVPYNEVELSDEEYALYNELTSLEAVELKSEDEDLKIYEPIIEETENPYADLVTIGGSDIDSIERVETEVTFDAVDYSFQNLYHTLETSSMLGFGQPRDFNVLLKATMKASRKIVEGDKFEVEILSKTLPILNGEEGRANDIQIDGKVVAIAEYIAEEHKIVYTFVEDLDTDKVEIEQEFKQIKEEKAALLNMLDVSENLVLDAVRGAEGDEDSEENPDELEISPEFEENLIQLKLGNTPVQYNGVSFETKKFRLKTTMTAKAVPMWKIPKGWTFDVNIGPYLKPEYDENSEPILKPLYDPNNPRDKIATPTYDPKTHTITYKYVKDVLNTKKIDIDQLLAFDTKEIRDKDKINIDITVKPKDNPTQKMYTITVRKDDPRTEIPSLFELDINENGEPNLNDGYEFFEYGPSYKVTFDASATPIVENREVKAVEWTVVFDGNGENLNSKNLNLITNFTAVRNSGLEKIQEVNLNGEGITLTDNDMGDGFLINDSKYFDGHNYSESVYTFKFKTPVDSKQKAYVLDIAAKLRGVKKIGAVRLIMPAYEGAKLEMLSPNDMTHSNRTTISGKFTAENSAEWIVTEEVSTGDQGSLPLIERNISENQTINSLNVAYYGIDNSPDNNGKMHQIKGETPKENPIAAGNLVTNTTFAPGTIAVYEYKTSLLNSDKPQTYTLSNGAISKYRDVDLNVVWSKQIEGAKYPAETVTLTDDNEDRKFSVEISAESGDGTANEVNTKIPSVKIWDIDQYGKPQKIKYTINQEMPNEGNHDGKPVQYGEVFKTYEQGRSRYEIQNYIAETKSSKFGKISINKTDEGGNPLSGAVFRLYGVQDTEEQNKSKTFAFSGTSSVEGKIEFSSVPPGVYTLQEERSPIGYERPVETDRILVNEDGSVEWTNDLISSVSYKPGSEATGWKSDTKYYNGSFSWPGYMNSIDYTEVDKNNNFTSYIMLKPDANTIREGTEYFYTDRNTRVSMFGEHLNITGAQIFDVAPSKREEVKNAMYGKTADKLSLGDDISNDGNKNGAIVNNANYNDTFLGKTVHAIMLPYKRFGEPNPGWGFLIKVTGTIDDSAKDSTFSYRWLTTSKTEKEGAKALKDVDIEAQTKIESDTTIPVAENRNSAMNPTFTITNKPAKMTSLNIQKQDDKGNQLYGAEFRLYNAYGDLIKSGTTSSTGKLTFEGLAPGEYKLKETRSPNGYDNPELEFTLRVSQDGSILYSATDKNGNVVEEGDYYRVGNNTSTGPVDPQGESKITVQSARMYLDEGEKYGKRPGVWEEAAYESYSFEGVFDIKNSGPGDSWIMDFDDNWNFTQWSGKLPEIKSDTGKLIATGKIDYTNNQIKYTLADTDYVNTHRAQIIAEIKLNSIRPSKYYVKNNGLYSFRDVINVGINQKTVDTIVKADLGQFYGQDGNMKYITQNVDIYKDKVEDRYLMRNVALYNVFGNYPYNGEPIARIYYGSSINNGREILFGDKQKPTYKPIKVVVYEVNSPNRDNMPLSCGIRPSDNPAIYKRIAEYDLSDSKLSDSKQGNIKMDFDPDRVDLTNNYLPQLGKSDNVQFKITFPKNGKGYVIEQFYEIIKEELERFENTYTQTFMFHNGGTYSSAGVEQIRPTLNSGAGIGGDYTPPQPKNYDLTVFNKKEPGEFIVKKISKEDSPDKIKTISGAEFILLDERNYVVRKESSNINGIVEFKGLSEGTYTLKETASPEGYKPTDKTLTVKVDAKGTVTFPDLMDNDEVFRKATKNELVKKVKRTLTHENDTSQALQTHAGYPAFMNILSKVMQKSDDTVKTRIYLNPKFHSTEGKGPNKKTVLSLESLNADSISTTVYEVPEAYKGDIDGYLKGYNSNATRANKLSEKVIEFSADKNSRWSGAAYVIDVEAKYDKPVADIGKTVVQERLIDYKWYCDPDVNTYMKGKVGTTAIAKTELVDSAATGDGIEEITETGISIIEVVNEPNKAKVTIVKVDEENTKQKLSGAVFKLLDENGEEIKREDQPYTVTTGDDGKATFEDLEPGTYTIIEESAPKGYELTNKTWTVVVKEDNTVEVTENSTVSKTVFGIDNPNTNLIGTWNYTSYQKHVLDVSPVIEQSGDGYVVNVTTKGTSDSNDNRYSQLNMYFDTEHFEFEDKNVNDKAWFRENVYFNSGFEKYSFKFKPKKNVELGSYKPITGITYVNFPMSHEFLPTFNVKMEDGQKESNPVPLHEDGNEFSFNVSNKYKGYEVEFEKIGIDKIGIDNDKEVKLSGAKFKLQMKIDDNYVDFTPVYTAISDAEGKIKFNGLKPGEYKVVETDPPAGYYVLNKDVKFFKIDDDGKVFIMVNGEYEPKTDKNIKILNNKPGRGKFKIVKTDGKDKVLEGVIFRLYNSRGDLVGEFTTNEKGEINFENLPFDRYTLREFKTLPGYILDKEERIILIGEQWDVPKDVNGNDIKGSDVSRFLELNKVASRIESSSGTDTVKPNKGEVISVNLKYNILSKDGIKPGDTFTLVTKSGNVDLDSISRVPDYKYDIYGPAGRLAVAKIGDDRKSITYTFTEYLESATLTDLNIGMLLAVDRFTVKNSGDIYVTIDFKDSANSVNEFNKKINVDYTYSKDYDLNACLVKYIDGFTQDPSAKDTFRVIYYIKNHRFSDVDSYGKNLEIYSDDVDFSIDEIKAYKVESGNEPIPWSFGLNLTANQNDTDYGLKWVGNYFYEYPQNSGKYIINLNPDDLDKSEYVIEVKGTVNNLNDKPFTLKCQYNRVYRQFDENNYYYDTPIYEVATVFKRKEETSSSAATEFTLSVPNYKNKIEYTKVDGSLSGTAVDTKPEENTEGNNKPMSVPRPMFSSQGNPLEGAKFVLKNGELTVIDSERTSDKDGKFSWEGLAPGKYDVWETKAPEGYPTPKEAVSWFTVNENGEIVDIKDKTTTIKNYKKPDIEFQKIDGKEKKPLKDAEFTLYKAATKDGTLEKDADGNLNFQEFQREVDDNGKKTNETYVVTSGEDGKFKFEKLEDGIYAVKETKAPAGYTKLLDYAFFFKVEGGKIYEVNKAGKYVDKDRKEVTDKAEANLLVDNETGKAQVNPIQIENFKAEYPSTGGVGALPFVFIGMMIMMVGAYMFIRRRDALYE